MSLLVSKKDYDCFQLPFTKLPQCKMLFNIRKENSHHRSSVGYILEIISQCISDKHVANSL